MYEEKHKTPIFKLLKLSLPSAIRSSAVNVFAAPLRFCVSLILHVQDVHDRAIPGTALRVSGVTGLHCDWEVWGKTFTLPKINIEPKNDGLEDDFPFQGACILRFHVNLPGCTFTLKKSRED